MAEPQHQTTQDKVEGVLSRGFAYLVLAFLVAPLLVIVPLSFNAEPYFTFTTKMLTLDRTGSRSVGTATSSKTRSGLRRSATAC